MKVGLIGAGRQGWRRAQAIEQVPGTELAVVADVDSRAGRLLAKGMDCEATANWKDIVERNDLGAVIITTPNHLHAPMCIGAMRRGKHVLCEKPLARNIEEAKRIIDVARKNRVKLKCGFNLRHHPGMQQARQWFDKGSIGQLMFLRCRYGMCGRPGYEKEWRAKRGFSGGGELIDQGVHVLDLFRWFAKDFSQVVGFNPIYRKELYLIGIFSRDLCHRFLITSKDDRRPFLTLSSHIISPSKPLRKTAKIFR